MLLKEWCERTGISHTSPTTESAAVSVVIDDPSQHSDLWNLEDYIVTSVCGIVIWLTPRPLIRLTAEHQSLLQLACLGMYLSNDATDTKLQLQASTYGHFGRAFYSILDHVAPREAIEIIRSTTSLDLSDYQNVAKQIKDIIENASAFKVVLL